MNNPIVIVGCGGFGREVWSILQAPQVHSNRWRVEGFIDDDPCRANLEAVQQLGLSVLSDVAALARRSSPIAVVLAIGRPAVRKQIRDSLRGAPIEYPPIIHPDSTIGWPVHISEGVVISAGARISTNITLGAHVHVDQNATIGHDSTIGEFSRLNPQACVSGSVNIGRGVQVGANATILQGLTINDDATVGACACVTRDVEKTAVVKGVPAR